MRKGNIKLTKRTSSLVIFGTNYERAAVEFRERLAFSGDALTRALRRLPGYALEGLILSTCNRTEIYALIDRPSGGADILRRFVADCCDVPEELLNRFSYVHEQEEAVWHLYRVASGLESMVLGEPQILSQIRDALAIARQHGAAGPIVTRLATDALHTGKRARTETGIARNRLSIPHAAVALAARRVGSLQDRAALVVGSGQMATLAAKLLRAAGVGDLVIVNRTPERGFALAQATGGRSAPLTALGDELARTEVAVVATSAQAYVVDGMLAMEWLGVRSKPLVAIDLGVPRNIDPEVGTHPMVSLYDVDDLEELAAETRSRYEREIEQVEAIINEGTGEFFEWWHVREVVPTIAALREHAEEIRVTEVERALRKLGHLSPRDQNVVQALSVAIVNKLLHHPIVQLRGGYRHDVAAHAVQQLFGLDVPGHDRPPIGVPRPANDSEPVTVGSLDQLWANPPDDEEESSQPWDAP